MNTTLNVTKGKGISSFSFDVSLSFAYKNVNMNMEHAKVECERFVQMIFLLIYIFVTSLFWGMDTNTALNLYAP